jgi:hypothetical protein
VTAVLSPPLWALSQNPAVAYISKKCCSDLLGRWNDEPMLIEQLTKLAASADFDTLGTICHTVIAQKRQIIEMRLSYLARKRAASR